MCNGDVPAVVPARIIDDIRACEDEDGYCRIACRASHIPGEPVRVAYGAFRNCCGLFYCLKDNEWVAILLDLLGRKVQMIMPESSVVAS